MFVIEKTSRGYASSGYKSHLPRNEVIIIAFHNSEDGYLQILSLRKCKGFKLGCSCCMSLQFGPFDWLSKGNGFTKASLNIHYFRRQLHFLD